MCCSKKSSRCGTGPGSNHPRFWPHSTCSPHVRCTVQATLTRLAVVCPHGSAAAAGSCQGELQSGVCQLSSPPMADSAGLLARAGLVAKLAPGKVADGDAGAGAISGLVLLYPCCSLMLLEVRPECMRRPAGHMHAWVTGRPRCCVVCTLPCFAAAARCRVSCRCCAASCWTHQQAKAAVMRRQHSRQRCC